MAGSPRRRRHPEIGRDRRTHMDTYDEPPVVTPRIGEEVSDVIEADIAGCYHLITAKQPTPISDTGYAMIFDSYPTWQMVGGRLVPMSEEEAQQAHLNWSAGAHQPHEKSHRSRSTGSTTRSTWCSRRSRLGSVTSTSTPAQWPLAARLQSLLHRIPAASGRAAAASRDHRDDRRAAGLPPTRPASAA